MPSASRRPELPDLPEAWGAWPGLGWTPASGPVRLALVELAFPDGAPVHAGRSQGSGRHAALDMAVLGRVGPGVEVGLFAPEDRPSAPDHRIPGLTRAIRRAVRWAGAGGVVLVEVQLETWEERGLCLLEEPRLARACAGDALVIVPSGNHAARLEVTPPPQVLVVGAVFATWARERWELRVGSCGWGPAVRACAWGSRVWVDLPDEPRAEHCGTSSAAALVALAAVTLRQRGAPDVIGSLLSHGRSPLDDAGHPVPDRVGLQPDLEGTGLPPGPDQAELSSDRAQAGAPDLSWPTSPRATDG